MWCKWYYILAEPYDRVMQLNLLYFCGICQLIQLKLWSNTAQGCNHQSICMPKLQPQLQPLCSAALVPNVLPRRNERTNDRTNEQTNEWIWMIEWTNERMNERKNERKNERTNERTNEQTNEWKANFRNKNCYVALVDLVGPNGFKAYLARWSIRHYVTYVLLEQTLEIAICRIYKRPNVSRRWEIHCNAAWIDERKKSIGL